MQNQKDDVCILHKKSVEYSGKLYIKIRMKSFKDQQGRAHFRGKKRKCPVKWPKLAKRTTVFTAGTALGSLPANAGINMNRPDGFQTPVGEARRLLVIFF